MAKRKIVKDIHIPSSEERTQVTDSLIQSNDHRTDDISTKQTGRTKQRDCKYKICTASCLKILAMICMFLDHSWVSIIPGNDWMHYLGRLAFPLFAFQLVEGFFHTTNLKEYKNRLLLFAIASELPFNVVASGSAFFPFHQNTLFTLLLGLLMMESIDLYLKKPNMRSGILTTITVLIIVLSSIVFMVDYNVLGLFTILVFYFAKKLTTYHRFAFLSPLAMIVGIVYLNMYISGGQYIPIHIVGQSFEFPVQGFATLSLLPILLYNGRKGKYWEIVSKAGYLFYPTHLLYLSLIIMLF